MLLCIFIFMEQNSFADALHNASMAQASGHGLDQQARPSPEIQAAQVKRENTCRAESMPGGLVSLLLSPKPI